MSDHSNPSSGHEPTLEDANNETEEQQPTFEDVNNDTKGQVKNNVLETPIPPPMTPTSSMMKFDGACTCDTHNHVNESCILP